MIDVKLFLASLPGRPGVYCMRDKDAGVLYVGKAKDLKKRVSQYFRAQQSARITQMVNKIATIDITVTASEKEALLLEISLIKSLKPRYNVIFRDDKSFPYLFLSAHVFPRLNYFRGKPIQTGEIFGPYPNAMAVKETLSMLQKLFKIRSCDDQFFSHRRRPCLQYEIQRCSAPCTAYISEADYAQSVEEVRLFLKGKQSTILDNLVHKMEACSQAHDFEQAGAFRDRIIQLRAVFDQQNVYRTVGDLDVLASAMCAEQACIHILRIRGGQIKDSQTFFPQSTGMSEEEIVRGFLMQCYIDLLSTFGQPHGVVVDQIIEDRASIEQMLCDKVGREVKVILPKQGEKLKWLKIAQENAQQALERRQQVTGAKKSRWDELKKVLGFGENLHRIECFDVSHTQGEATVASCVVFEDGQANKSEYRRYGLGEGRGDDYNAMFSVLARRYLKRKLENVPLPEVIIVDGGKGQLRMAERALLECQASEVLILAIAKGEERKPGLETIYALRLGEETARVMRLPPFSKAFQLLQHIRDESHREAVKAHRRQRAGTRKRSVLEDIPGIGPKRRQALINYFGGWRGVLGASQEALTQVPGVSVGLAALIYQKLHEG